MRDARLRLVKRKIRRFRKPLELGYHSQPHTRSQEDRTPFQFLLEGRAVLVNTVEWRQHNLLLLYYRYFFFENIFSLLVTLWGEAASIMHVWRFCLEVICLVMLVDELDLIS